MNFKFVSRSVFLKIFFVVSIVLVTTIQCNDQDVIPYVWVNFELNIYDPDFSALQSVGGFVYLNGGFKGLIIYRRSIDEFRAYDRSCTYQPAEPCEKITVDKSTLFAECACCGSRFMMYDGMLAKGPAARSLVEYEASVFDELTGTLHISNKKY